MLASYSRPPAKSDNVCRATNYICMVCKFFWFIGISWYFCDLATFSSFLWTKCDNHDMFYQNDIWMTIALGDRLCVGCWDYIVILDCI